MTYHRDVLAHDILVALLQGTVELHESTAEELAKKAYALADAMLAEAAKPPAH